ncbi:MAG: tetratricopeptide repeat protein [Microcystaceae cyanobacterium]
MSKRQILFSLLTCATLWSTPLPTWGQAILPYTPTLDVEKLEEQGLALAEDAIQLVRFRQYELALGRAKLATQLAPNQYQTWFILGSLYIQQEELDLGVDTLNKALSLASEEEKAGILFTLGNAYFQTEDYDKAAEVLEDGLKLEPETPTALFDLGNVYLKMGRYGEAITAYDTAVDQEKDFWPAINNIGLIQYEQGKIDDAIAKWEAAVAIDDQQSEPQLALAVAFYMQGEREKGLKLGAEALKADGRYAELDFLEENLWGEKLLRDTATFFATPTIKVILDDISVETQSP